MKFLRDRVEQRWQLEIRRRRGGVEQPIERGVTYERTGPDNVHKSPMSVQVGTTSASLTGRPPSKAAMMNSLLQVADLSSPPINAA